MYAFDRHSATERSEQLYPSRNARFLLAFWRCGFDTGAEEISPVTVARSTAESGGSDTDISPSSTDSIDLVQRLRQAVHSAVNTSPII
jgi:hypothetical protein